VKEENTVNIGVESTNDLKSDEIKQNESNQLQETIDQIQKFQFEIKSKT